jgi:hypothetical protein
MLLIIVDLPLTWWMVRAGPLSVRHAAVHTSRRRNSCAGRIRRDEGPEQVGRGGAVGAVENREEASAIGGQGGRTPRRSVERSEGDSSGADVSTHAMSVNESLIATPGNEPLVNCRRRVCR